MGDGIVLAYLSLLLSDHLMNQRSRGITLRQMSTCLPMTFIQITTNADIEVLHGSTMQNILLSL